MADNKIEDVERLQLQVYDEKIAKLQAQELLLKQQLSNVALEFKLTQEASQKAQEALRTKYSLTSEDSVSLISGEIIRKGS